MSYILDALRKSETERRQGRIPDLGQQVQLIHNPRRKSVPVLVWVALGLVLNAVVLAWVFWPQSLPAVVTEQPASSAAGDAPVAAAEPATGTSQPEEPGRQTATADPLPPVRASGTLAGAVEIPTPGVSADTTSESEYRGDGSEGTIANDEGSVANRERPTVIVPTPRTPSAVNRSDDSASSTQRAPHLVELPLSFQKRVPDLIFNSHIYASEPSSRRVMINDNYLRPGESFSGITVERITEEGVELSMDGRRFRVGVVRNWVSPE